MRLLSPDETLILAMDGLLALPQRRGIPLPLAILPFPFLSVLGFAIGLVASVKLASAFPTNGLVLTGTLAIATMASALTAVMRARRRLGDARSWTPAVAARYRSDALMARETMAVDRYLLLAGTVGIACAAFAIAADLGPTPPGILLPLVGTGLAIAGAGRVLVRYADCAMPRDPDATFRSPAAQALT